MEKKIAKHLRSDIKTFHEEAQDDRKLLKSLGNHERKEKKSAKKPTPGKKKFEKVLHEYKAGDLRSGSKKGPKVTNKKQALAIAFSEKRRAKKKKKK
jgi:hypothetical protein